MIYRKNLNEIKTHAEYLFLTFRAGGYPLYCCNLMAGGEGFEPPLAESESAVLPLDDPPVKSG